MKTSASETEQIDRYLLKQMPVPHKLVFDAQLILCPNLQQTMEWQRKVHQLLQMRGRQNLQAQIKEVEQKVFSQPEYSSFRERLMRFFG